MDNQDYGSATQLLTRAIEVSCVKNRFWKLFHLSHNVIQTFIVLQRCPWSPALRELRSTCHLKLGDTEAAIHDLRSANKLLPDNTGGYYKISQMQYQLGQLSDSLK